MGLYGAMTTAVAGLTAQSYALENISGNIANSQTTGFKRVDTSFSDIVMSFGESSARQNSGSVLASSRATNSIQGAVESSNVNTFMAISGDGYFQVQRKAGESDGAEIFTGADNYTRRGDFKMDKQGYLVNGAGYYLKAIPIDSSTGNPIGDVAEVFKLSSGYLAANPSKSVDYNANLPAKPKVGLLDQTAYGANPALTSVTGSPATVATKTGTTLYNPIDLAATPTFSFQVNGTTVTLDLAADGDTDGFISLTEAETAINSQLSTASVDAIATDDGAGRLIFSTAATGKTATITMSGFTSSNLGFGTAAVKFTGADAITPGTGTVLAQESATFTQQSLDGGSVTLYDQQGTAVDVQLRWAKMSTAPNPETWNLFYEANPQASGAQVQWQNVGTDFTFDSSGNLTAPASGKITLSSMSVAGNQLGNIELNMGATGLTQYSAAQGTVDVTLLSQDGYASGSFSSIGVGNNGRITATYSNGQQIDIAEVPLYKFNADQELTRLAGSAFAETRDSGTPLQMSDGKITGSALEASNTDIAEEFSKMIVTQQAYSANSKIISTTNTMMQDILNIIR